MKLKSARITNFKCIRDTGPFEITDITCLVGKNEAGKTAILEALYRLNPIIPEHGEFNVDDDYPRIDVEDYRFEVESGEPPAVVVEVTYSLDDTDLAELKESLGSRILNTPELILSKGYANDLGIELSVSERAVVNALIKQAELEPDIEELLKRCTTLEELNESLETHVDDQTVKQLQVLVSRIMTEGLPQYIYSEYLENRVPKFLYFNEYYQMEGQVNIQQLNQRKKANQLRDSDRPLLGLIELARLDLDQLRNPTNTEFLVSRLEGTSNHLNKQVLKYWSQNKHLEIKFDIRSALPGDPKEMREGVNLWGRVHNLKHKVSTLLGRRSRGFVWFFSFLAWFSQQKRKKEPIILLLDEPGLILHAKAQQDVLRYMEEELKPSHQVIYTTHSPFMVDPTRFDRVRIVEDKSMETDELLPLDQEGTKVLVDVLETSEDSLFPLQGALGYELYQTLFIGPNSLVVEGVSDLLYIQAMSGLLEAEGCEGLDSRWTITPVGGSDKVPTFVALIGAQRNMRIATLIDIQKKDVPTIENLYKKKLLKKKHVLTYGDFTGSKEADVEDMFNVDFYLGLVNAEYQKDLSTPVTETDLSSKAPRVIVRIEEYLQSNPFANNAKFNHYRPARYFVEQSFSLKGNLTKETLDRFEQAFKALNALL